MRKYLSVLLFALIVTVPAALRSQSATTATVSGTVVDEAGANIPGAKVTMKGQETGLSSTAVTDEKGGYIIQNLAVGTYTVIVEHEGFTQYSVTGITLHPASQVTIDASLKIGAVNTVVTVSAAEAGIETTSSELSSSVTSEQVSTLPTNGRNYQGLATLMPGAQNISAGSALGSGGRSTTNVLSVNGMQTNKTFYALDGIWNENTANMTQTTITPNPDSLQEVKVLQNNFSVKYSLMGSSVVLLQTRSGTHDFHGAVWEFLRNDALNSKPYFATSVLPYKQNIFGYNVSGPVFIPNIYNTDRSRTFFFLSQSFIINHQVPSNLTGITPTANQRNGVFSSPILNPATGTLFATNGSGQYVIPASSINSNSTAYLNALYPLPNYSSGSQNYINPVGQTLYSRDDEYKVEHNFNTHFHLVGEYLDEYQQFRQNSFNGATAGQIYATNYETDFTHNKLAQGALTTTITPRMINLTSISMNIYLLDLTVQGLTQSNQVAGFNPSLPYNGFLSGRLPQVTFSGGIGPQGVPSARPLTHAADLDDTVSDDWSYSRGKHYLQSGLAIVFSTKRQNQALGAVAATNGLFTFTGQYTKPATGANTSDDAIADFLLGKAATFSQVSDQRRVAVHAKIISPYLEDKWNATKRLTLTAGIRVLHEPLPSPPPQFLTIFDPSKFVAANAPTVGTSGVITKGPSYDPLNGLVLNGSGSVPQNFTNAHNWFVSPMFGFAYDVTGDGRTALRGGYGISYSRVFVNTDCSFQCASNPPALQNTTLSNTSFPNPVAAGTVAAATIQNLNNADLNIKPVSIQTYSLGLQHEFPRSWTASVTGAGNIAQHVLGTWNRNQPGHFGVYDYNPAISSVVTPTNTPTQYQFAPYQGYGAISTATSSSYQNWQGLETSVTHPIGSGLFITFAYTYSHDLQNFTSAGVASGFNIVDIYNPAGSYGNAEGLDYRHSASFSAIYTLPIFREAQGVKRALLSGWKISDVTTIRSGTAITPALSISGQGNSVRPNAVAGASLKGPKLVGQWFNTSAFVAPAPGYFGNAGTGSVTGPGLILFDMAFYKEFHLTESRFLEFRTEAFNVFNHTNFTTINATFGNASYGQATAAADPRILEGALKIHF